MLKQITIVAMALSLPYAAGAQAGANPLSKIFKPAHSSQIEAAAAQRGLIENDRPKQIIYYNDSAKVDTLFVEDYTYLTNGKVATKTTRYVGTFSIKLRDKEVHTYVTKGSDTIEVIDVSSQLVAGGPFEPQTLDTTITSALGMEIYATSYNYSNGAYHITYGSKQTVETYPNNKLKLIMGESINDSSKRWEPEAKIEFILDANGDYKEAYYSEWDADEQDYVENTKLTDLKLRNNDFENPESATMSIKISGMYIPFMRINTTYTPEGWPHITTLEMNQGSGMQLTSSQEYQYDAFGNVTKQVQIFDANGDDVVDTFITSTIYTYDQNTRVTNEKTITRAFNEVSFSQRDLFYGSVNVYTPANLKASIQVYPNPAENGVSMSFGNATGNAYINILDVTGRVVKMQHVGLTAGQAVQIELNTLPAGIYNVNAIVEGKRFTGRIVKR